MPSEAERLAVLEYKDSQQELKLTEINAKLDEILVLRNKGLGAFWLATTLLGTGIFGVMAIVFDWFKG